MNREGVCGAEAEEKGVLRLCTIVILGWGGKKGLEAGEDGTLCHKVAWVAVVIIEEGGGGGLRECVIGRLGR